MRRPILILTAILLALGAIEGLAWWWMNPAPAGLGEPVLVYRPSRSAGVSPASEKPEVRDQESEVRDQESDFANQKPKIKNQHSSISSSSKTLRGLKV